MTGADSVTLAAGSTTTGISVELGAGDDSLDLASTAFGALDGGVDTDTLSVTGTGITLDGDAHSNFETLIFTAGSNTLSGTHTGLASTIFNAGTTILTGSLASTTAAVASGAALDLAADSSLTGDLSNSGMLTVAGSGFGSATITGDLVLNANGSLTLDTNGAGGETDLLMVSGVVTLGGTLMLRQTTMPEGMVTLIDGGTALSGNFASSNEMSTEGLVNGLLISQTLVQDGINFDLQLVTTVTTPVPMPDPEFPTGCVVMGGGLLADGGTLTCISGSPITEALATTVDGVSIIIGESATQTTVMPASGDALSATIASTSAAGNITINSEFGTISGAANGIYALNAGTGTTSITVASVSATSGVGILTRTRAGASITINAGGTVSGSGGMNAIETQAPSGDSSSTPSDTVTVMGTVTGGNILTLTGADTVTLAAGSTTTGITIDLGEGNDRLNLASAAFGTLDGGADADTLSISGTGITLDGDAHSNFETLIFAAGSNTLSGTHTDLASSTIETGAMLDLAADSSLSGDLSNSGMLTVAGSGFGSATITGDLVLNADGSLTLDTNGAGGETDLLMVSGAVTLGGTLMLRQTTMPEGMVTLIDGGTALSGNFASSNEMSTEGLVNGLLISQTLVQDGINFDLQLVTTVTTPVPMPDPEFPTGCVVMGGGLLADGGTLTCISGSPITEAIATNVDGVSIIIGKSATQTTVMPASGDALSATIAGTSAAGNISINSAFGIISGGTNGIVASTAGSGSITITGGSVTGNAGSAISATTAGGAIDYQWRSHRQWQHTRYRGYLGRRQHLDPGSRRNQRSPCH